MRIAHLELGETHSQIIKLGGEGQWEVGTIFMGDCSHITGIVVRNGNKFPLLLCFSLTTFQLLLPETQSSSL